MLLHETLDDYWTNYTNTLTTRSIYTARVDIEYTRFRDSSQIHGTFLNMDTNLTQLSRQMCALYTRFCTLISHTLDDYRTFLNKQLCHILYRLCEFSTKLRHDIAHIYDDYRTKVENTTKSQTYKHTFTQLSNT